MELVSLPPHLYLSPVHCNAERKRIEILARPGGAIRTSSQEKAEDDPAGCSTVSAIGAPKKPTVKYWD